ncbi:putative cytochrome P450 124 [Actinomadura rubteroloni]|uniref:Putative cytochrome P450 124 n=1 Tax=Actinomadura rubteroloni TaxID=1926885 RepID=A0A2P4UE73_9ACTN|nr:cytochrome P450 [Actinomadura rubteroloni]POM23318.1 putative cytochrome P450 124 [Actinomadura rubteroloni]
MTTPFRTDAENTFDNPLYPAFWKRTAEERDAFFSRLRAAREPIFFPYQPPRADAAPYGFYALARHAEITEVSRHPEIFSSSPASTLEDLSPALQGDAEGSLLHMDPPRHTDMRRVVSQAFTPRAVRRYDELITGVVKAVTRELLDKTPCDFVTEAAVQLPLRVIAAIVGVPVSAHDEVVKATEVVTEIGDSTNRHSLAAVSEAVTYFNTLMGDLARHRRVHPADDVVTTLVQATINGRHLTDAELGAFLRILLVGGNDTVRSTLAHMLTLLTENPEQKRLLLADLDERMPGAVEEAIRHATPGTWMRRNATQDTTVAGHAFRTGDRLILYYISANRDEEVFDRPYAFDITRNPNPHVGFGAAGPHYCLGAHLAKHEVGVFYRELLTHAPDIHATEPPVHTYSGLIHSITRLPCARSGSAG